MFQYKCLNPISQTGLGLFGDDYKQTEEMNDADAILVRSAKMHDMELPENVKVIARAGAGVNNIPVDACAEKGIVVFNTPGANANGVKELVLAGMLLASRDIVGGIEWVAHEEDKEHIDKLAEKQKKQFAGCEISGKKLGIIGLGAIGAMVANSATHLGMEVYGYDPFISIDAAWNLSRTIKHSKSLDEIYSQCDYITIHVPLTDNTRKMIDREAFLRGSRTYHHCPQEHPEHDQPVYQDPWKRRPEHRRYDQQEPWKLCIHHHRPGKCSIQRSSG